MENLSAMVDFVRGRTGNVSFDLAMILGSGLDSVAELPHEANSIPYREIPDFPQAAVAGHPGRLVAGTVEGRRVLVFAGRFHCYEGYSARQATLPIRLARELGSSRLLLTNAAGGVNPAFDAGDIMFIADHLNLMGDSPIKGMGGDFLDLSNVYETRFFEPLKQFSKEEGTLLHCGILAALPGPCYETPAEVRMLRLLGADAVSMSTVPEAIMAKKLGMEVAGFSLIANRAAGLSPGPLNHQEVLTAARSAANVLCRLAARLIRLWD